MIKADGTPSVVRRLGSTRGSHPGLWGIHLPTSVSICWNLNMRFSGRKVFIQMLKGSICTAKQHLYLTTWDDNRFVSCAALETWDRTVRLQVQKNQNRHLKTTRSISTVRSADELLSRSPLTPFSAGNECCNCCQILAVVCVLMQSIALLYMKKKVTYKWGTQKDYHLTPWFLSGIQKVWKL